MNNRKKRRYRRAAACLLLAVLLLSAGTGVTVLAENEQTETESQQEIQNQQEPETNTAIPEETGEGTGSLTEPSTESEPAAEPESNTETEIVSESETSGGNEAETETDTETESKTQTVPQPQLQSVPPAQNQILGGTANNVDEAVQSVQEQINSLPEVSEVQEMDQNGKDAAYIQAQNVWDAYNTLTDDQKEQVEASRLTGLLDYFNGQVTTFASSSEQTENSVASVTRNGQTLYYDSISEAFGSITASRSTYIIKILKDGQTLDSFTYDSSECNITLDCSEHSVTIGYLALGGLRNNFNINGGNITTLVNNVGNTITVSGGTIGTLTNAGTVEISGGTISTMNDSNGTVNAVGDFVEDLWFQTSNPSVVVGYYRDIGVYVDFKFQVPSSAIVNYEVTLSNDDDTKVSVVGRRVGRSFLARVTGIDVTDEPVKITAEVGGKSASCDVTVTASYTVSIPQTASAGGDPVSITVSNFHLNEGGRVKVNVLSGAPDGTVTLTMKESDPLNPLTVTSRLLDGIDGNSIKDGDTIAVYNENAERIEGTGKLYFTAPTETDIAAGTYFGNVTFQLSYEIQQN